MSEVRNILEARARRTLGIVPEQGDPLDSAAALAEQQIRHAQDMLARDYSSAPRWAWSPLDQLSGPMLDGDLLIIGALHGNGKSALLMSQMDAFAASEIPTLYVPLEIDPWNCRTRWASWKLNLDATKVLRHEWSSLEYGAMGAVDRILEEQKKNPFIQFAPPKRMTVAQIVKWCQWAQREYRAKVIMLDHFHRVAFGSGQDTRINATEAVRSLKDMARDLGVVLIMSAQINRNTTDPLDRYIPPSDSRLKETSGLNEEADVVLMLSRKLRRDMPEGWQQMLRLGQLTENELGERNVMVVTCRKHRLDDKAMSGRVQLSVERGKVIG